MTIIASQLRAMNPGYLSRGRYTTEMWEVWDSTTGLDSGDYNYLGVCVPEKFDQVIGLPQYGNPHPVLMGALVTDVRVSEVCANWSYLVQVTYRSWGLYSGGPRQVVRESFERGWMDIPVWRRRTDGIITWWEENPIRYPRPLAVRVETRWIGGNQAQAIQDAIVANVGQLYTIGSTVYRLSDRCSVYFDGISRTRADYAFEREAPVAGIAAGSAVLGNDVAIPALPGLFFWSSRPDPTLSSNPPIITAVPPLVAVNGSALPGFP